MPVDAQGEPDVGLATVRVARKRIGDYAIGNYYVVLDGGTIGKVASGCELTSPLEPGRHQLKVRTRDRVSRSRTLAFEVGAGKIAHFECELKWVGGLGLVPCAGCLALGKALDCLAGGFAAQLTSYDKCRATHASLEGSRPGNRRREHYRAPSLSSDAHSRNSPRTRPGSSPEAERGPVERFRHTPRFLPGPFRRETVGSSSNRRCSHWPRLLVPDHRSARREGHSASPT